MKALGTLLLIVGGAAGGYVLGRAFGKTEEEKKEFGNLGLLIGGGVGLGGAALINHFSKEKHDTVNYTLKDKKGKERVYEGISFEHCLDGRINAHERDGKKFDTVISDSPKPRSQARDLERKRIKKFTPKYNIQHNKVA